MAHIEVDNESRNHILKQIKERYPSFNGEPILSRMINTLKTQAPEDWRFTISPSARFFVVDRATKVKILGYFERLTPQGINKAQRKVFSYDMKGVLIPLDMPGCPLKGSVCGPSVDKSAFKSPREFRSDTYWMLPTYLDNRYIGLEFREREPFSDDFEPLCRNEMAELYFLKKIIAAAKGRF